MSEKVQELENKIKDLETKVGYLQRSHEQFRIKIDAVIQRLKEIASD